MKKLFIILLLLSSCSNEPQFIYEDEQYSAEVVDKKEAIETDYVYTENIFGSGDSILKKVPETKTVYYVIFDDGTVKKVSIEQYYQYKIGTSYYLTRRIKRLNPKYNN